MQKLSGIVLDVFDDPEGEVLRSIFPTSDDLPEIVKTAQEVDLSGLPDDVFALILHNDDLSIRKYACVDAGNTALSVEYFMKLGHKLPVEAQKTAAQNLLTACGWYGIEVPEELTKVAVGLNTLMSAAMVPSIAKGTKEQISQNLATSKGYGGNINAHALNFKPTASMGS